MWSHTVLTVVLVTFKEPLALSTTVPSAAGGRIAAAHYFTVEGRVWLMGQ
jgi:hypothetical protein